MLKYFSNTIGAPHLREVFYRMGLSDKDIVALSGGHTLVSAYLLLGQTEGSFRFQYIFWVSLTCRYTFGMLYDREGHTQIDLVLKAHGLRSHWSLITRTLCKSSRWAIFGCVFMDLLWVILTVFLDLLFKHGLNTNYLTPGSCLKGNRKGC